MIQHLLGSNSQISRLSRRELGVLARPCALRVACWIARPIHVFETPVTPSPLLDQSERAVFNMYNPPPVRLEHVLKALVEKSQVCMVFAFDTAQRDASVQISTRNCTARPGCRGTRSPPGGLSRPCALRSKTRRRLARLRYRSAAKLQGRAVRDMQRGPDHAEGVYISR